MNASSSRPLLPLLVACFVAPSCALVLDLDAERGEGGAGEGGRLSIDWVGGGDGTGGDALVVSTSSSSAASTSGQPACDGYALFSGQQLMLVEEGPELDLENEFAIMARVKSAPDAASADGEDYEGYVFSRLSPAIEKGYALLLAEMDDDGAVYPELRVYTGDEPCGCVSGTPVPPDTWVNLTAGFEKDKLGSHADAGLWVDGVPACVVDCGGDKLETFTATPVVGAALDRTSGFFRGAISELAVVRWKNGVAQGESNCGAGKLFTLSFDAPRAQTFAADCPASLTLTLGISNEAAPDDPQVVPCP